MDSSQDDSVTAGQLTVKECLRLSRAIADQSELPASCRAYLEQKMQMQKAYEGAGALVPTVGKYSTKNQQAQLQRRWTSTRNPLKK